MKDLTRSSVGGHVLQLASFIALTSVAVQTCLNLWLLHREFELKLAFAAVAQPPPAVAQA